MLRSDVELYLVKGPLVVYDLRKVSDEFPVIVSEPEKGL